MFIKFPKLEHYSSYKDLITEDDYGQFSCRITEKIDGQNFGCYIPMDKTKEIEFYSRNGLQFDISGFPEIKQELTEKLIQLRENVINTDYLGVGDVVTGIYLNGEYYGRKAIARINYNTDHNVKFFSVKIIPNNNFEETDYLPISVLNGLLDPELMIEETWINSFKPTDEELVFPVLSKYTNHTDNSIKEMAEGYVIWWHNNKGEAVQILKHKSPDFDDKVKHTGGMPKLDKNLTFLNEQYKEYINENRVIDVFSKFGRMPTIKEMILAVQKDAQEDFVKDYPEMNILSPKDCRKVFNVGSKLFLLIDKVMKTHA